MSISKLGSFAAPILVLAFAAPLSAQGRWGGRGGGGANVPPGQRPPAGMCRVWIDGVPPGRQPAPTDCATAYRMAGPNARVIDGRGGYGYDRTGSYDRGQYGYDRSGYGRYEDQSFPGKGKGKWKKEKHRDRDYDRDHDRDDDDRYDRRNNGSYDRGSYDRGSYDRGSYGRYDRRDGSQAGGNWPWNGSNQPRTSGYPGQSRLPSRLDPRVGPRVQSQSQVPSRIQPRIGSRPNDSANGARRAPWERRPQG